MGRLAAFFGEVEVVERRRLGALLLAEGLRCAAVLVLFLLIGMQLVRLIGASGVFAKELSRRSESVSA